MSARSARPRWWLRLQASRRFRAFARAFPPTRPIARARARALFDLCAGFVYAQVLQGCVRLDLFALLQRRGAMTAADIAAALAVPAARLPPLLEAAVALRLLGRDGGAYGLGPLGAAMIDNPGVAAMIAHHDMLYEDLADPVALLRNEHPGALRGFWPYAGDPPRGLEPAEVAPYGALMAASQDLVAAEVLDAYPIRHHRTLLDVGGGEGAFLQAVAARAPSVGRILFDLPPVAARAEARLGAGTRCIGGDMFTDDLPRGADAISLVRVLHDHDDDAVQALLRRVRAALPRGGMVLIAEPMAETPGATRVGAYFHLYLLAMGQGRPRSAARLRDMLEEAGFRLVRVWPTRMPIVTRLVTAVNLT